MTQTTTAMAMGLLLLTTPASAQDGLKRVDEADTKITTIHAKARMATLIVLDPGEQAVAADAGDKELWKVDVNEVDQQTVTVKPTAPGLAPTNLHIRTTAGTIYTLRLQEAKPPTVPDERVLLVPSAGGKEAQAHPQYFPKVYVDSLQATQTAAVQAAEQSAAQAREEAQAVRQQLATRGVDAFVAMTCIAPKVDAPPLRLRVVCRDGQFTYLKLDPTVTEEPALYETKDGKPERVNYQVKRGPDGSPTYVALKVMRGGYLIVGDDKPQTFSFGDR